MKPKFKEKVTPGLYSKEQAIDALQRYQDHNHFLREYLEAIVNATLPQYYLTEFLRKKNEYLDDLPDVPVSTLPITQGKEGGKVIFKCQGNYVVGLILDLKTALNDKVIDDPTIIDAINSFLLSDLEFAVGDPKNTGRIARINNILDKVIGCLQNTVKNS